MIKLFLPALIVAIFAVTAFETKADSLVCQYYANGEYKTLIYTEIENPKPNEIETVHRNKIVFFNNGSHINISASETDCIFFNDPIDGEQTALNHFLSQIKELE